MEEFYCVSCSEIVTTRQEALLCDRCERWQHRRCGTGITRETYRRAVRELDEENVPADFLRADVRVKERRHIILATKTPVGATSQGQKLVHGCNFQASVEAIYTAVKHQRVCEVGTVSQTGSRSVCFDFREKKSDYKKVRRFFLFIFYYVRDIIWDS